MESKSPWYLPSQYLTKRWQKMHLPPSNTSNIDRSLASANNHRSGRIDRNMSTQGLSNRNSFVRYQIQELCLQDNKLLIIDQTKQRTEVLRPYTNTCSYRELNKNKYKRPGLPILGKISNSHLLKTQVSRQKLMVKNESGQINKTDENVMTFFAHDSPKNVKNEIKKTGLIKKKGKSGRQLKLKFTEQEKESPSKMKINIGEVKTPKVSQTEESYGYSPSKGLRPPQLREKSLKSTKSVKSAKSMKSFKSNSKNNKTQSKKSVPKKQNLKNQEAVEILPQIFQTQSQPLLQNQQTIMAQLFDPTQLLSTYKDSNFMMDNPYDDFPEWSQYLLVTPPTIVEQENPPANTELHIEQNAFQRKKSLPLDFASSNILSVKHSDNKKDEISKSSRYFQNFQQKLSKRYTSMVSTVNRGQMLTFLPKKERCMTTKVTDKPPDSPHLQNFEGFEFEPAVQTQKTYIKQQTKTEIQQRFTEDSTFNIKSVFPPEEMIHFIDIKITNQTAYFPCNLKEPIFIVSNPSSTSLYQNKEIIDILNLFLKFQPSSIQNMFDHWQGRLYQCTLCGQEGPEKVIVDGLLPFDSNYYSLFGSVEQYIWFPVLMKAIAKTKGSYKSISDLTFKQMFSMITNKTLIEMNSELKHSNEPLALLYSALKQTKSQNTYILVTELNSFYAIDKIFYRKPVDQKREEQEEKLFIRKSKMRRASKKQLNMASLASFIKEQKGQLSVQRMKENTILKLIGAKESKNIILEDLLTQQYKIYQPIPPTGAHSSNPQKNQSKRF